MSERGEELKDAADGGHEGRVSELLAVDGINVNYKDSSSGWSPLHKAAAEGHPHIIRLLHQAGAQLEIRDKYGNTPLHKAGYYGRPECAALLLLLGAEINSLNGDNITPLHRASSGGETATAKLLIECGADTEVKNKQGETPRDKAGNDEIKSLFAEFEKQERHKNKSQLLKNAIDSEKWEVATILALNGASEDPDIFANILNSVLSSAHISVDSVFVLIAKLGRELSSIDRENKMKLLSAAFQCENFFAVKKIFDAKVNDQYTLPEAIAGRYFDLAIHLIADGSITDDISQEAWDDILYHAAQQETKESKQILVSKLSDNGSIEIVIRAVREKKFQSAISLVQQNESLAVVRTVLTNFVKTIFEVRPNTIESPELEILKIILEKKDILETDEEENTPLHISTRAEKEDLTKFILENGGSASQFRKNKKGQIPKSLPTENNDISQVLVIDFISFALKSPEFETEEFQQVLGYGKDLFCLKPIGNSTTTLLEFILQRGMIKEREELLMLLKKIDKFRRKTEKGGDGSKKRIIKILRAGIGPCRELKECIDSLSNKYPWTTGKVAVMGSLSVLKNIVLGGAFYFADIYTDVYFAKDMYGQQNINTTSDFANCQGELDRRIVHNAHA